MSDAPAAEVPKKPLSIYRGWEAIGNALEVDEDTAFKYASRPVDPLPVYYDHAGRPCSPCSALNDWEIRQALPFYAFHELKGRGRLPAQIANDAERKAAQRTKVAQRGRPRETGSRVNSGRGA